jgi:tetratricopeptide (TPR) repeat protein/transcriptional regulator with XRE-family HTH domain
MGTEPAHPAPSALTFAALLRARRRQALLSQEQLAARSGLSVRAVRNLEHGRVRSPRGGTLRLLADALQLAGRERAEFEEAAIGPLSPAGSAPAGPVWPPSALTPYQLPPDVTDFTGRGRQLQQLECMLAGGDHHGQPTTAVVIGAIAGTAGVGKTALAVHWAHQIADRFPDGQLYIDLRGYATTPPLTPAQALATLLRGLGIPPDQIPMDTTQAAGLYRSLLADKQALVVLDNVGSVGQVRPLLPGSPGCLVIVTSRDRLSGLVARDGARRLILDVLTAEEAHALLAQFLGRDRAQAEPQAAIELARVCAYLPLALRIAAANLADHPYLGLAGYVDQLTSGDRLAVLQVPGDTDSAVKATFDLSYQAIPADAQRLFRLLGLVPGPDFTPAAAAALTGADTAAAQRLLDGLAAAHLIGQPAPGRYAFHDLLRLYAREQCRAEDSRPERQAAVGRLLTWYLRTADSAARLLFPHMLRLSVPRAEVAVPPAGFDDPPGALAWLEAERANLVAAVQHAATAGPPAMVWLLASCLRGYFWLRRHLVDWLTVAEAALVAAVHGGDLQAQAASQLNRGDLDQLMGRNAQALDRYAAALALAQDADWLDGQAVALGHLGILNWLLGQLRRAAECCDQALALSRQTGRLGSQGANLCNLGKVDQDQGRLQQAADHLGQALALFRRLGSRDGEAVCVANLGMVAHHLGRLDDALNDLTRALTVLREIGNRYGEADTLNALAAVHCDAGRHTEALKLCQAAATVAADIVDQRTQAQALNIAGRVRLRQGHPQEAMNHHWEALELARQTGARTSEIGALLGLAEAHRCTGHPAEAAREAGQALTLARESSHRVLEAHLHTTLAAAYLDLERLDQAAQHAQQALDLHRQSGHRLGQVHALVNLGEVQQRRSGTEAAQPYWQEALRLATDIGSPEANQLHTLVHDGGQDA